MNLNFIIKVGHSESRFVSYGPIVASIKQEKCAGPCSYLNNFYAGQIRLAILSVAILSSRYHYSQPTTSNASTVRIL